MNPLVQSFALGLGLSAALVPVCRVIARRFGVVAHPRDDRWHRTTVPLLGGLALAVTLLVGMLATRAAFEMVVPLAAALLISIVGLVDDVLSLKPATKLIAQIALAAALVYFGYRLNWLESRLLDSLVTIVWVVGLTNAFNLLDNMDGLCAGIALIVAVMLMVGISTGVTRDLAGSQLTYLALLAGATVGFLIYNFPPASVFMGDGGSLLLGFSLAALTLSPEGVRGSRADVVSVITAPVFVLLIPIFDTSLVTALRLLSGRSPARGGRDHSSHRLVAMGLSERTAILVLCFLAAVGGAIGNLLRQAEGWSIAAGGLFVLAMGLFAAYLARIKVYDDPALATPARGAVTPLVGEFLYKRRVAEVMLDFCLITIAYYGAYNLRFEGGEYLRNVEAFYESLSVVLATQLVAFFIVGVYRGVWRHFGLMDGVTIVKGVVLGTATTQLIVLYAYQYDELLAHGLPHLRSPARRARHRLARLVPPHGRVRAAAKQLEPARRDLRRRRERRRRAARAPRATRQRLQGAGLRRRRPAHRADASPGLPGAGNVRCADRFRRRTCRGRRDAESPARRRAAGWSRGALPGRWCDPPQVADLD